MNIKSISHLVNFILLLSYSNLTYSGMDKDTPYYIEDGKVDELTYVGYQVFSNTCVGCHGVGATGSTVAPDLTEIISNISEEEFSILVLERYAIKLPANGDRTAVRDAILEEVNKAERANKGEIVMPDWENDPIVKDFIEGIYSYLRSRSDGAIGPGMIQPIIE